MIPELSGYLIPLTDSEARTKLIMLFANILPKVSEEHYTNVQPKHVKRLKWTD